MIAHEYFHNWTGNRITCRDWFQLCLKEGLTVFRDHEFSADQRSRAVRRIADVRTLRAQQFPEDAGPLAHNVRPDSYFEINNFYTATVYEKGAEIIRMLKVLIGADAFRRGMDLYFERHDGTAATVEEFHRLFCRDVRPRSHVSSFSGMFRRERRSSKSKPSTMRPTQSLTLDFRQSCDKTPGQDDKTTARHPDRARADRRAWRDFQSRCEIGEWGERRGTCDRRDRALDAAAPADLP